jgi:DNA-binding transcriptional ArsR family regulator
MVPDMPQHAPVGDSMHTMHTTRTAAHYGTPDARIGLRDDVDYAGLARLFGALADPTRVKIVHLLMDQEWCTSDIAAVIGVSEPGVSQHLRLLRMLRLVRSHRRGKFVYYRLDDAHVATLVRMGLSHQDESSQAWKDATLSRGNGAHS